MNRDGVFLGDPDRTLSRFVSELPPGKALDTGCGCGRNTLLLLQSGWQVTAIDFSPAAVSRCKQMNFPHSPVVIQKDLTKCQPVPDSYDLIVLTRVLEFLPVDSYRGFFRRLHDSLTDRGLLFLRLWSVKDQTFHIKSVSPDICRTGERTFINPKTGFEMHYFTNSEADILLSGYRVIHRSQESTPVVRHFCPQPVQEETIVRLARK